MKVISKKVLKFLLIIFVSCSVVIIYFHTTGKLSQWFQGSYYHPCPRVTRDFPILKKIDRFLIATAGISWYKAKEKSTGRLFLINLSYDDNEYYIYVIDDEKRDKWEVLNREEYLERFEQPADSERLIEKDFREIEERRIK